MYKEGKDMNRRGMSLVLSAAVTFTSIFAGAGITVSAASGISGDGSQEDPYVITNYEGLKEFGDIVNTSGAENFYAKLGADIKGSANDPLTPIGDCEDYRINFDGNGKTISNVTVEKNYKPYAGFFGNLGSLQISEVTFEKCSVTSIMANAVGMVVGYLNASRTSEQDFYHVNLKNCSVHGTSNVGGLIGSMGSEYTGSGEVNYCTVEDSVISGRSNVGGIVGNNLYQLTGCQVLNSSVRGDGTDAKNIGGIVGNNRNTLIAISATAKENHIASCTFSGQVSAYDGTNVGGIAGYAETNIYSCKVIETPSGNGVTRLYGLKNVGGVVGNIVGKTLAYGTNVGRVTGTDNVGGIVGTVTGKATIKTEGAIHHCDNTGSVTGTTNVGGICGDAQDGGISQQFTMDTNSNAGSVKGKDNVGGIVGRAIHGEITNNTNKKTGTVTGTNSNTGGIIGTATGVWVNGNKNQAEINGQEKVGGLAGALDGKRSSNIVKENSNEGAVNGTNIVGGLVGQNKSVYKAYPSVGVPGPGNPMSEIEDNQNYGKVTGEENVAGLVGKNIGPVDPVNMYRESSAVRNCENSGDVYGKENVAGCIASNTGVSENNKNTGNVFAKTTTKNTSGTVAVSKDYNPDNLDVLLEGTDTGSTSTTKPTYLRFFEGDVMIDKDTPRSNYNNFVPPYGEKQNSSYVYNGNLTLIMIIAGSGSVRLASHSKNQMGLLATPESGYVFSGWVVGGKYVSISPYATFDTSKSITVGAVFFKDGEKNPQDSIENYDPNATATPKPTVKPTQTATPKPTAKVTVKPTQTATPKPTAKVTVKPTQTATPKPTAKVTVKPTQTATPKPTAKVTVKPTQTATPKPTAKVTVKPTQTATPRPTQKATAKPTATVKPSATPTTEPVDSNVKVGEVLIGQNASADPASDLVPPYGKGQNSKTVQARNLLVSVVPVGAGSVSVTFISNDQTGLLATATKGYAFSGWVVDGKYVSTQAQTFFGVSEEMKVSAVFYKQGQKDPKSEIENYLPSQTETPAPGQSEAPNPTPGNSPMPNPIPSPAPGVSPLPSPVPGAGSTIIGVPTGGAVSGSVVTGAVVKDGTYIYVITNPTKHYCKVTGVVASKKKTIKFIKVPNAIRLSGVKYRVTAIDKNAFKGLKKVTKVRIDTNVKTIGIKAFYNCKKLKKVTIRTKKLKKIGKFAFKNINKKATIKVPKKQLKKYTKMLKKSKVNKTVKIR